MIKRNKKFYKFLNMALMASFFIAVVFMPEVVLASNANAVTQKLTAFETLFEDIVSSLGTIVTLWAISEWGLAWNESNGTVGAQSFKRILGGVVVTVAPQILPLLT